jgi:hypothetical protein
MATSATKKWASVRARPATAAKIARIARPRDMKLTAVLDAMVRGWELLTDAQREEALTAPTKGGAR